MTKNSYYVRSWVHAGNELQNNSKSLYNLSLSLSLSIYIYMSVYYITESTRIYQGLLGSTSIYIILFTYYLFTGVCRVYQRRERVSLYSVAPTQTDVPCVCGAWHPRPQGRESVCLYSVAPTQTDVPCVCGAWHTHPQGRERVCLCFVETSVSWLK